MLTGDANVKIFVSDGSSKFTDEFSASGEELRFVMELLREVVPDGLNFSVEGLAITTRIKVLNPTD